MKTKYFAVSFSPYEYDVDLIRKMNFEDAKKFFNNDKVYCSSIFEGDINNCDKLIPQGSVSDLDILCVWFY